MTDEFRILVDFAEGKLSSKDFEQEIYTNKKLEALLSNETVDWSGTYLQDSSPFLFLAEQNYDSADGRLNAQGAVQLFLKKMNIEVQSTKQYSEDYDLLLATSPKYLDIQPDFFEKYILPTDRSLSKPDKKLMIKKTIAELFKYQTKPPKWIQNPNWLIKNNKPLYFLGQVDIKKSDLFHDDGSVYLFADTETGSIETVKQFY
ncbi:hypothetical protein [Epilithonimonas xixisoli]|uniref:Uncharacterized protein n=1 Tax=Epilithonimonas xixisoli TaxID=1476462 RepID=A0A4R8IA08_9FLAO|nr:hypothetical protein [Epilithonimonas xixisoli]TDX86360.1 hypothetical protein B0I22_0478 [Epilithonimonas xixisoli]